MSDATLLRLSFSAYAYLRGHDLHGGRAAVHKALDFFGLTGTMGWFAVSDDGHQFNFALAFVVVRLTDKGTEYNVVVRGTNPLSLESWFREDFNVASQVPWPGSADGGKISQASATALSLHEGMRDEGRSLYAFLQDSWRADTAAGRPSVVRFTGHSLGGLVAPLLALRLAETGEPGNVSFELCTFAAPTAGDKAFAAYLERTVTAGRIPFGSVRFIRCRDDVAVKVWNKTDMLDIVRLYAAYGVPINGFLLVVLLLLRRSVRHLGYTQPFSGTERSQTFRVPRADVFSLDAFDAETYLDGGLQTQFHRAKAVAKRKPSPRVFRNTLAWVVQAVVMHIVPYATHLLGQREQQYVAGTLVKTILTQDTFFVERRRLPR